jgi:hypothetical protein
MLCDIQPPLIGQAYGMLSKDIFQLVFASRHQGYSLFPIKKWPAYVHVALTMKDNFNSFDIINDSDIKLIAWAELYNNKSDAIAGI